jgi:D-glycero-beta-D-manno-heptose 1-phosphate adenylyltransferase
MGRVLQFSELEDWRKNQKGRVVATNGCFDVLHVGHLRFLTLARSLGDVLIVGINGDASVRALKGAGRPINTENDRAEMLAGLSMVDYVVIFPEARASTFLAFARPTLYVKGGDYKPEQLNRDEVDTVTKFGGRIKILPLIVGKSTTGLVEKIEKL